MNDRPAQRQALLPGSDQGRGLHELRGVGPRTAKQLAEQGLLTLADLLFVLPRAYEDRTRLTPVAALCAGQAAQVEGKITAIERVFRGRPQLRIAVEDEAGDTLVMRLLHFRAAQIAGFQAGRWLKCFGEPRPGLVGWEMVHPRYQMITELQRGQTEGGLSPVYPKLEGIGPTVFARLIDQALGLPEAEWPAELFPEGHMARLGLPTLAQALRRVHRPAPDAAIALLIDGSDPAIRRLVFEELVAHRLIMRRRRLRRAQSPAPSLPANAALSNALRKSLPFKLTGAQHRVVAEIEVDLGRPTPMQRLMQGDVGSGKTVVAALAIAQAAAAGYQTALVAPTELLAEQHRATLAGWFEPFGIEPVLLLGKTRGRARAADRERVAGGAALVIGTHALMQQGVEFAKLGLVIVDEQHRFGVHQRLALVNKALSGGALPHQLVLSATPIPRTLAMGIHADLDISSLDERPPGRQPVRTVVLGADRRAEVVARIREACLGGRQAYWVCTLIEDSDEIAAQAAEATFDSLTAALPELRVALIHGRLASAEKQATMARFVHGEIDVLVATTVIEVGVDVPNASLMLIENAERLGLAQLHQLRGRVGRGSEASSCVLFYRPPLSAAARERLDILRRSDDGFEIAQRDLELRGPGELLGTRQTGLPAFRIADFGRDAALLPAVAAVAEQLLAEAPRSVDALVARWIGDAARFADA